MKNIYPFCTAVLLFAGLFVMIPGQLHAQSRAIALMDTTSLEEQFEYIYEKTLIYNDYRAIREDVFQKLRGNVRDTVNALKLETARLNSRITENDFQIETLNGELARTRNEKDEAIRNKDSFSLLGIQVNKALYSTIMWLVILGLAVFSVILFGIFRRSQVVTREVKDELLSTQEEFDLYRRSSREKYEKLVFSHHKEIMKLKNS